MTIKLNKVVAAALLLGTFTGAMANVFNPSASTGVVFIGDQGKDNEGQHLIAQSMQTFCVFEDCDLGMTAGDNVYHEGVSSPTDPILETRWDKYYNPLNMLFLITLGNHDYGKFSNDWKRGSYQLLHAQKNPLFYFPAYYYSYETEESVFAVIDTTRLMWKKETAQQAQMVQQAYAKAKQLKKWFFVLGHHPYLSNGKHGNAGRYERLAVPYFVSGSNVKRFLDQNVCGKAHFYLSGHDHNLQLIDGNVRGCNTQLILSGSAASTTKLYKRNPVHFESSQLGYFHLAISPEIVSVKAVDQNASVMFTKSFLKQ